MYLGVALLGGGIIMWELFTLVGLFFIIQYYFIISLEEETLRLKFKDQYKTYTENVPKLLPRITPWKSGNKTTPKDIFSTIKTEKRTLQNIFFIFSVVMFKTKIIALFYFL